MNLDQKIGQLFFAATFINPSEQHIQQIEKLIREQYIGGLCFFHSAASAAANFEKKTQVTINPDSIFELIRLVNHYQSISEIPLLICIDAEWGLVMRIEDTPRFPFALTLGAVQNNELVYQTAAQIAKHCRRVGIHVNFAPVMDINSNPSNPAIGYRSFGEFAENVTEKALVFMKGLQDNGVLACGKHFPGHGDTDTDSHLDLPVIKKNKKELYQTELIPFQKAIEAGLGSIMTGHLSLPQLITDAGLSASLSMDITTRLLREELGFRGLVFTDALNMRSVADRFSSGELEALALEAGNDVLLYSQNIPVAIEAIKKAVSENRLSEKRIEESIQRIANLKDKLQVKNSFPVSELSVKENLFGGTTKELQRKLGEAALTLMKGQEPIPQDWFRENCFVQIGQPENNVFQQKMEAFAAGKSFVLGHTLDATQAGQFIQQTEKYQRCILALFIPFAKPLNRFGIGELVPDLVDRLIQHKQCILYFFGNPYALRYFPGISEAEILVMAYQDADFMQEAAFLHLSGQIGCQGKLPIAF